MKYQFLHFWAIFCVRLPSLLKLPAARQFEAIEVLTKNRLLHIPSLKW